MMDILVAVAVLFGIPVAISLVKSWKREQREHQHRHASRDDGDVPSDPYWYWGGTGRPGK